MRVRAASDADGFRRIVVDPEWIIVYVTLRTVQDRCVHVRRVHAVNGHVWSLSASGAWTTASHRMMLVNRHGALSTTAHSAPAVACPTIVGMEEGGEGCVDRAWRATRLCGTGVAQRIYHTAFLFGCTASPRKSERWLSKSHSVFTHMWPIEMFHMRLLSYRNVEFFTTDAIDLTALIDGLVE